MKLFEKLKNIPPKTIIRVMAGIILGAVAGYIYYIKVGCVSGTCAITSNPYLSIFWGAVIGYLVADLFGSKKKVPIEETGDKSDA